MVRRFSAGWSEFGRGLYVGVGGYSALLNLWGAEQVTAPYLACFLPPSPPRTLTSPRQPLILDVYRPLFISSTRTHSQHQHQTKIPTPKQTRPKPTLKQRFRSLKAFLSPDPPGPVHVVLARLPLPPPLSAYTWTRWYAAARSYTAWLGKRFDVGREGELGEGEDAGGRIWWQFG